MIYYFFSVCSATFELLLLYTNTDQRVCVCARFQGDASCRRSALLKDDNLLDFYFEDTKTVYDMFQRGLRIAGEFHREPPGWSLKHHGNSRSDLASGVVIALISCT